MIDSCRSYRQQLDRLSRKTLFYIRTLIAVVTLGLGLMAALSFAAAPTAGASSSDVGLDIRLDKVLARRQQTGQSGITSPATGSSVSGSVPILGTVAGSPFARYELYYKQEPSGDEAYVYFGGDSRQIRNGQLGDWQTGALAPGIYTLRMRVVRPDGNYGEFFAQNISVSQEPVTPTADGPTETPIPIDTPTPFPQPTVVPVQVEQPDIEEPTSEHTATPAPVAQDSGGSTTGGQTSSAGQSVVVQPPGVLGGLGEALALDSLRARFFAGVRWSAGLFLLLGAIFAAKRLLEWVMSKAE